MFNEITFNNRHGEHGTLTDDAAFLAAARRVAELERLASQEFEGLVPNEIMGPADRTGKADRAIGTGQLDVSRCETALVFKPLPGIRGGDRWLLSPPDPRFPRCQRGAEAFMTANACPFRLRLPKVYL